MVCFTFMPEGTTAGIGVTEKFRWGKVVILGSKKITDSVKIPLNLHNCPDVLENMCIYNAAPVLLVMNQGMNEEKRQLVLEKPSGPDNRYLVRLNTYGSTVDGISTEWKAQAGAPTLIAHGMFGGKNPSGKCKGWLDDLVIMSPGDVIIVTKYKSSGMTREFKVTADNELINSCELVGAERWAMMPNKTGMVRQIL
jgi:hypothetical protein